jgi:large subunit ribosomal protein L13e
LRKIYLKNKSPGIGAIMSGQEPLQTPTPTVNTVKLRIYGGVPPRETKIGKGFSIGEINALGLTVKEARLLGIRVDIRRKTTHEENINLLRAWLAKLKEHLEAGGAPPKPAFALTLQAKPDPGRVFKGKTMSGRKMRGLLAIKYRHTHHRKWKKKQLERIHKRRHEATRHKGGD